MRLLRELLQKKTLQFRAENEVFFKSEWPVIEMTTSGLLGTENL